MSSSLPVTPRSNCSSGSKKTAAHFRYDPYNNFAKVYCTSSISPSNSRSVSGATTPRSVAQQGQQQGQGQGQQGGEYYYSNVHQQQQQQQHPLDEVVSTSMTPTNRMETEQQLQHLNQHHLEHAAVAAAHTPSASLTPRRDMSSIKSTNTKDVIFNSSSSSASDDENAHHEHNSTTSSNSYDQSSANPGYYYCAEDFPPTKENNNNNNNTTATQPAARAPVRTMQHLLQNVPYLFLEPVATATMLCRKPGHRVGQQIAAWSAAPEVQQLPQYAGQAVRDVFVAQLPFDLPLSTLQSLADLLIEGPRVHILHAAPHVKAGRNYDGCCFVKMFECDADRFIYTFHKKILFDVDGCWVAGSTTSTDPHTALAELQELTDYCAWFQEQKSEQRKEILKFPVPYSAVTAEHSLRASRNYNNNNHNNQQQYQNQQQQHFAPSKQPHIYPPAPNSLQQQQQQQQRRAGNNNNNNTNAAPAPAYDQNPHQRQFAQHYNYYAQQLRGY